MFSAENSSPHEFPTTQWTLIRQALADGTSDRTAALEELVACYQRPLRAHLTQQKRLDEDLADELLQGFITEKILEQYLLRRADRAKGKFRSLLVSSLGNYYLDMLRSQAIQPAAGMDAVLSAAPAESEEVSAAFDVAWASQLLDQVLALMRANCEADGQADIWGVFECRLLAPVYARSRPIPYEEICQRFGFASPEQAANALVTAKRKFQRAFERIAVQYQHDGEMAEDILRELLEILSSGGPLEWRRSAGSVVMNCSSASDLADDFSGSRATQMLQLLDRRTNLVSLWCDTDLGAIMRHQLAQRLCDLDAEVAAALARSSSATMGTPLLTLADLYRHPQPPLELLQSVKRFGRSRARRPDAVLPDEIASTLYFASIATALVRLGERISSSDNEVLKFGFERAIEQSWMENELTEVFNLAVEHLSRSDT